MMMRLSTAFLAWFASISIPVVSSQPTLDTALSDRTDLATFNEILDASGLDDALFMVSFDNTVFAPTDEAFGSFPVTVTSRLLESEWKGHSACFVSYHIAEGILFENDIEGVTNLTTIAGDTLEVSTNPTAVNEAEVIEADIRASNGVVHIIDAVFTPPCIIQNAVEMLMANEDFSILVELIELSGLLDMLSTTAPITIFAPPNKAWEGQGESFVDDLSNESNRDFLRAFLMNHVVQGNLYSQRLASDSSFTLDTTADTTAFFYNQSDMWFMNNAELVVTDLLASNGVIHETDGVVILAAIGDVLLNSQIVSDEISFSNFTSALKQAYFFDALFLDNLNNPRTTTVFGPDDNAFANAPIEVLDRLLDPSWSYHLRELLRYHLVDGTLKAEALTELNMLATFSDFNLTITSDRSSLQVNEANVIFPDLATYNGVVHGIDAVLFPPSLLVTILEQIAANPELTEFLGALKRSQNLTALLEGSGPLTLFIPTNAAFELMTADVLSSRLDDEEMEMILQYHIVEANVFLNQLSNGTMIETMNGQNITVTASADEDEHMINSAQVLDGGLASNGVIFVLDEVLIPLLPTVAPTTSAAPTSPSAGSPVEQSTVPEDEPTSSSAVPIAFFGMVTWTIILVYRLSM